MKEVLDVYNAMNEIAPFLSACEWDNCGLIVGDMQDKVTKVYVTLDADAAALKFAKEHGCELVISHHPIIFSAVRSLTTDDMAYHYIKNSVSVICSHTCLDLANGGINDIFAKMAGMEDAQDFMIDGRGLGRYGNVKTHKNYLDFLKDKFNTGRLDCIISCDIKKAAVVSGSGGSAIYDIKEYGVDTLITGEAKHEHFVYAENNGLNLIALGHFETENVIIQPLCARLSELVCGVEFIPSCRTEFIKRR